jgi:hypothetical protein
VAEGEYVQDVKLIQGWHVPGSLLPHTHVTYDCKPHSCLRLPELLNRLSDFIVTLNSLNALSVQVHMASNARVMRSTELWAPKRDRLSPLPTELMAKILKQLSTREICRARTLCRHFKELVDANQTDILRSLIAAHKARIKADHKALHCKTIPNFESAFKGFVDYYGRIEGELARADVADRFFTQYIERVYGRLHHQNDLLLRAALTTILKIVTEPEFFVRNQLNQFEYAKILDILPLRLGDDSLAHCLWLHHAHRFTEDFTRSREDVIPSILPDTLQSNGQCPSIHNEWVVHCCIGKSSVVARLAINAPNQQSRVLRQDSQAVVHCKSSMTQTRQETVSIREGRIARGYIHLVNHRTMR